MPLVEVETDASVESLKTRAQSALVVPNRGRLLNSSGEVLDGEQTVTEAKLRSGDVLTLHVNQVQLKAAKGLDFSAFAALLGDGSVTAWGDIRFGGDCSAVQEQLHDVQQIQASASAFASILGDGSVVTWGDVHSGGDSSSVQDQLRDVQQIQASRHAFAAIRGDGSVVTWGDADYGGDTTMVATAVRYRSSCEMCSRSKLLIMHLLQSGVMDLSSPGAMPTLVATAVRYSFN